MFLNFSFCSLIKCCFLRLEFTKCLSEKQTEKTMIRMLLQKQSDLGLRSLSRPLLLETSVQILEHLPFLFKEALTWVLMYIIELINELRKSDQMWVFAISYNQGDDIREKFCPVGVLLTLPWTQSLKPGYLWWLHPERIFLKVNFGEKIRRQKNPCNITVNFKKKSADVNKSMKNYPACKEGIC